MNDLLEQFITLVSLTQQHLPFVVFVIALLWFIQLVNFVLGYRLNVLGIYPRSLWGLPGIIFSPFLHGNFNHLFFNSIPLFVLMSLVLVYGYHVFYILSGFIIVTAGFAVWLFGRKALHIGASAVIMGYWGFLVVSAFHESTIISVLLGVVTLYYFGGLIAALLPGKKGVSIEGHIFGCMAGILANLYAQYLFL